MVGSGINRKCGRAWLRFATGHIPKEKVTTGEKPDTPPEIFSTRSKRRTYLREFEAAGNLAIASRARMMAKARSITGTK